MGAICFRVPLQRRQLLLGIVASLGLLLADVSTASPQSGESHHQYWELGDLYASEQAWEQAYTEADKRVAALPKLRGSLDDSPAAMLAGLSEMSDTRKEVARLFVYASLKHDEDQRQAAGQERFGRARQLLARAKQATSWTEPELLSMSDASIERFLAREEGLARFEFQIRDTLRRRPHTLSEEGERILASASLLVGSPGRVYELYANASIPWPTITLSDGSEARLTQAGYTRYRALHNRADRKAVFDAFWDRWNEYGNGMGATLDAEIQANLFKARARNFDSVLQQNLFDDALPEEIYDTLVEQVNDALPVFHRYLRLRGRMLGIEQLGYHDIYPPLVEADSEAFAIDVCKNIVLQALQPLGDEYISMLQHGLSQKWIHSHPQEGKQSGAYVTGWAYDVHPYVLLNHHDDYESLSTFVHEWGHAVHAMLAARHNPWETYDASIFIAEIASTINEILLQDYMYEHADSRQEKLFHLGAALESLRSTIFRQTMFAEFERLIHERAQNGEPLTGPGLSADYLALLRRYHGEESGVMQIASAYGIEWAYIPHFYYDYYVFQYASAMSAAVWFADLCGKGREQVCQAYVRVLTAGGSDHPHQILMKEAALDMREPAAYQAAFRRMNTLMDRIEELLEE